MNEPFRPLTAADLNAVAALARTVWQTTYADIISQAQIDSMLAARYSSAALQHYIDSPERWFELALRDGKLAGFCACEIVDGEYKLDKIYIDPTLQRRGLGAALITRASERARALAYPTMILTVNKRNAQAIAAYRKYGFAVRDSVCVEIGNGFVMDDFILEKKL